MYELLYVRFLEFLRKNTFHAEYIFVNFCCFLWGFFNLTFSKKNLRNNISVNSLDPDQA